MVARVPGTLKLKHVHGDEVSFRAVVANRLDHDAQSKLFNEYWKPIEVMVHRDGDEDGVGLFVRDAITAITGEVPNLKKIYADFKRFCALWTHMCFAA